MNAEVGVSTLFTAAVSGTGDGEGTHTLLFLLQKLHIREISWRPARQMSCFGQLELVLSVSLFVLNSM